MEIVGCDAAYIAAGGSYFTAETHIRHIDEVHAGKVIRVETYCAEGAGKKMHLFHQMFEGTGFWPRASICLFMCRLKPARPASHLRRWRKTWSVLPRPIARLSGPRAWAAVWGANERGSDHGRGQWHWPGNGAGLCGCGLSGLGDGCGGRQPGRLPGGLAKKLG